MWIFAEMRREKAGVVRQQATSALRALGTLGSITPAPKYHPTYKKIVPIHNQNLGAQAHRSDLGPPQVRTEVFPRLLLQAKPVYRSLLGRGATSESMASALVQLASEISQSLAPKAPS